MSGGSFDYACHDLDSNGEDVISALPKLREMENYLRTRGKHEMADEILRGILHIETAKRRLDVVGKHLTELAYAVEWWASGDWGEDQVDSVFRTEYLGENDETK